MRQIITKLLVAVLILSQRPHYPFWRCTRTPGSFLWF